jgi:hypothetical protein
MGCWFQISLSSQHKGGTMIAFLSGPTSTEWLNRQGIYFWLVFSTPKSDIFRISILNTCSKTTPRINYVWLGIATPFPPENETTKGQRGNTSLGTTGFITEGIVHVYIYMCVCICMCKLHIFMYKTNTQKNTNR